MKHRLKATALATVGLGIVTTGAHAQSQVNIYGLLDTGVTYVNRVQSSTTPQSVGSVLSVHPGAMQASRMGFRGVEDLGGGLSALFILESGVNVDVGTYAQGGAAFGRRSVVGLQGRFGTVMAGRQVDPLDDLGAYSSTIDFGSQVATIHGLDRTYADRTNNSIRYNSPRVDNFAASAIYGFGENIDSTSAGRAMGAGLDYLNGDLRLLAGYYQSALGVSGTASTFADASAANIGAQPSATNGVRGTPGDIALRTFTMGGAYQWGKARLHGTFSDTRQPLAVASSSRTLRGPSSERTSVLDLGISYAATSALNVNFSVIYDKVRFVSASSGNVRQYNFGLDYYLSKRTDVYANIGYQTASNMVTPGMGEGAPGGGSSQTLTRVGIRHKF